MQRRTGAQGRRRDDRAAGRPTQVHRLPTDGPGKKPYISEISYNTQVKMRGWIYFLPELSSRGSGGCVPTIPRCALMARRTHCRIGQRETRSSTSGVSLRGISSPLYSSIFSSMKIKKNRVLRTITERPR